MPFTTTATVQFNDSDNVTYRVTLHFRADTLNERSDVDDRRHDCATLVRDSLDRRDLAALYGERARTLPKLAHSLFHALRLRAPLLSAVTIENRGIFGFGHDDDLCRTVTYGIDEKLPDQFHHAFA